MKKNNIKEKLLTSMGAESAQLDKRFKAAEEIFTKQHSKTQPSTPSAITKSFSLTQDEALFIEDVIFEFASIRESVNSSEVVRLSLMALKNLKEDKLLLIKDLIRRERGSRK